MSLRFSPLSFVRALLFAGLLAGSNASADDRLAGPGRPNILFAIADDQSWADTGAAGSRSVETPAFDRVAREGVFFRHAFCAAPSCAPSRAAILTGRPIYRLAEGGNLLGTLPADYPAFIRILEQAGYFTGFTGKTWGPGRLAEEWEGTPFGRGYQARKVSDSESLPGRSAIDYAANFDDFLRDRPEGQPFFFWYGATEPHLPYAEGAWRDKGKRLEDAVVPACWPDHETVRGELLDYACEIEHFDRHLARMLDRLDAAGELDRTMIVVTADHGIPLPRAKCSLYDAGTRVPLAICWPVMIPGGRGVSDFISLADLAPTVLEAVGLPVPDSMIAHSFWDVLRSDRSGRVDAARDHAVVAFERHTWCRPGGLGYPMRALRTDRFLYVRNHEPARWPAGDLDFPAVPQGPAGDIDRSATKSLLLAHRDDPAISPFFDLAMGLRPREELYDVATDPAQVRNLAADPAHQAVLVEMSARLDKHLEATGDPRSAGQSPWDGYAYFGGIPATDQTPAARRERDREAAEKREASPPQGGRSR